MKKFTIRRAEDGRLKAAQIVGNTRIGGVVSCVLNYYKFMDRSRWRFDFFAYEHCGFDDALRAIDPAARVLTIPRLDRDPLGAVSALRRRLREGGYAVAHSHMTTLSAFALRAAKGAGVPVRVCHAHSTFDRHSDHYLIKAALRPFAAADATVRMACGELAAQNLFGRRAKEAVILPNAIDLERFAPDPQAKARLGLEGRCLLFVGRFAPQKNLPFLLDAFALALRRRPMTLLLLGAGDEEKALRARRAARPCRARPLPAAGRSRAVVRRGGRLRAALAVRGVPRCRIGSAGGGPALPVLGQDHARGGRVRERRVFAARAGDLGGSDGKRYAPPYRRRRAAAAGGLRHTARGGAAVRSLRARRTALFDGYIFGRRKKMIDRERLRRPLQQAYLLRLLVRRNIKNQYYRSFIGVLWTVLNPLLNMLVMTLVFSRLFGGDTALDYPIYILSGNIIFNIMRTSTSGSLPCLVRLRDMLQKTRVSIALFPTANVLSSLVTFLFSFVALLIVALVRYLTGDYVFAWQIVLVVVLIPAIALFSLGISYFLSALYVFFRDIEHLYTVILTLWTYLTPLFYTVDRLGSALIEKIMNLNPMYHYVEYFRTLLAGGIPSGLEHLICYGFAIASFAVGYLFMRAVRNHIAANL